MDTASHVVFNETLVVKGVDPGFVSGIEVEEYLCGNDLFPAAIKILRLNEYVPNGTRVTDNIGTVTIKVRGEDVLRSPDRAATSRCCDDGCGGRSQGWDSSNNVMETKWGTTLASIKHSNKRRHMGYQSGRFA